LWDRRKGVAGHSAAGLAKKPVADAALRKKFFDVNELLRSCLTLINVFSRIVYYIE